MVEFLTSLLLLIFSLNALFVPQSAQDKIIQKLEENFSNIEVDLPEQANPNDNIDETPLTSNDENTQDAKESDETNSEDSNSEGNTQSQPNTDKIYTYNTRSERPIGEVANVAVENAEPLVTCSENPEICEGDPTPTLSPIPTPTPWDEPEPIDPPEPTPPICLHQTEILCPQVICLDELVYEGPTILPCGCSCLPTL